MTDAIQKAISALHLSLVAIEAHMTDTRAKVFDALEALEKHAAAVKRGEG